MKYTKTHHQKLRNRGGYFNVVLALLFAISECSDNTPLSQKEQSGQQISQIDGKPIISISAADYYQADSDYIDKVINRLSHNGRAVVEAMNKQISLKANKLQNANSDAIFVGLSELKSTSSYKNKSTNSSNSLEDLSSHIRVLSEDGWVEEFELILEPHRGASRFANTTSAKLSAGSTWLALNPDHFYVQEDAQGNEIWPVTFPAVSVDDPDREIEVTLDRDGTLTWPSGVQNKSNSVSSENQMVYMDNMAVMDPCIDDGPGGGGTQIDPCGGGGGGTGGGSGGNIEHPAFQGINTPFLAIKTIRTDGTGDGSGGSELQMYVEPESYSGSTDFDRQWEYAFDIKYGEKGLPVTFGDGSFFEILGALLLFVTDNDLARSIEAGSIFEGYNSRTYGLDMRIYETPDVNSELVNYSFTNMRTWEEALPFPPDIQLDYNEVGRTDYFPAVLLNDSEFRVLLMEHDTRYPIANMRRRSTLGHDVWTYDMAGGSYDEVYTTVDGKRTTYGKSDDLMWHSGVRNITLTNAQNQQDSNGIIRAISPDDFMWEFVIQYNIAPFYDSVQYPNE